MKKLLFRLLIALCATVVIGCALTQTNADQGAPNPLPTLAAVTTDGTVIARAVVVPVHHAALSVATSGVVSATLVNEGDQVAVGAMLLQLIDTREAAAVEKAKADVLHARANLEELMTGKRRQELDAAAASLAAAQARLARTQEGVTPAELRAAQANVAATQQSLQEKLNGPAESALIEAKAKLKNAEAEVQRAQSAYNAVKWRNDIGALPESAALQEATNNYEAAQASYDTLARGASQGEIAEARSQVVKAQAEVDKLLAPPNANAIAEAEAEVRRLQAEFDLLQQGARTEQIQAAAADLFAAEATLKEAEATLAQCMLRAPFSGAVAALTVVPGEYVTPGQTIIQLADLTQWQIETEDLTEINIVHVQEGAPVTVTVDALPGLEMTGKVERIKPLGQNQQGDVLFTVVIALDQPAARLRWNMTAEVRIQPIP